MDGNLRTEPEVLRCFALMDPTVATALLRMRRLEILLEDGYRDSVGVGSANKTDEKQIPSTEANEDPTHQRRVVDVDSRSIVLSRPMEYDDNPIVDDIQRFYAHRGSPSKTKLKIVHTTTKKEPPVVLWEEKEEEVKLVFIENQPVI